jgi:hypothetical protein
MLAASALLACLLDGALSETVPASVEPSTAIGAIVSTSQPGACRVYGSEDEPEDVRCAAARPTSVAQAPALIATIAFMDRDGAVRSQSCPSATNRENSAYYPDAIQAMQVFAQLCAAV